MKSNSNAVMVKFLVGRNNFYHIGSRQCKRLDRVIFIITFKTLHNEQNWRDSRMKIREIDALSWARRETQIREVKGLRNIPEWTDLETNKRLSLSFPSLILTHSHILTHIYQEQSWYYICFKNSLKAQNTEHHIILNTPTRQDDLRLPRRLIWAFKKGLSDWVNSQLFLWKPSSFTFNSQFRASSPLCEMVQISCLEFHIVSPFIEVHK